MWLARSPECTWALDNDKLASPLKLFSWRGLFLVADQPSDERDGVFEPNRSTARVESTLRPLPRGAKAVDIGTGSGALALLLRRQNLDLDLVAIDVTARALDFVRFNFALNGLASPDLRLTDHTALVSMAELDCVAWNMPATYHAWDQLGFGFPEPGRGLQVLRELYASLPSCLSERGMAGLRHDMKTVSLDSDAFVAEIGVADGLQILFMHVVPDENDTQHDVAITSGAALVRRNPKQRTSVSFLPVSPDERHNFSTRRMWSRVLVQPGWEDALTISSND